MYCDPLPYHFGFMQAIYQHGVNYMTCLAHQIQYNTYIYAHSDVTTIYCEERM